MASHDNFGLPHGREHPGCEGCHSPFGGDFGAGIDDIASTCLQEEPPASVFSMRSTGTSLRSKSFSTLADQCWITVALGFTKEMEIIGSKRQEFTAGKQLAVTDDTPPVQKPKAKSKQKGKGRGRGNHTTEEEENH